MSGKGSTAAATGISAQRPSRARQTVHALCAAAILAIGSAAHATALQVPVTLGTNVGTDAAAISAALTGLGCSISDLDREAGHFEMLCAAGGQTWEIYVDAVTGTVTKVESTGE